MRLRHAADGSRPSSTGAPDPAGGRYQDNGTVDDASPAPVDDSKPPSPTVATLFDQLCLRWAREADVVVQQGGGTLAPTLVVLPRDKDADEVAIRLEGLRGNLSERAAALVAELRPQVAPHDPAGLVLMLPMRLGSAGGGPDGVVVYVTLGHPALRRALGFTVHHAAPDVPRLVEAGSPDPSMLAWVDGLLSSPQPGAAVAGSDA
jgi:hypothetical protein